MCFDNCKNKTNTPKKGLLVNTGYTALLYLYSAVAPVSYDDVPINVHSYTSGSVELTVSLTIRAKFQHQLSFRGENLTEQRKRKISGSIFMCPVKSP